MYKRQVEIVKMARAQDKNYGDYKGIKDASYLSNFIDMPLAVIVEYMHLSLEGSGKRQLDYFFNTIYNHYPFYINRHVLTIDYLLKKAKYTSSFSRTQRSITFYKLFKANEYRNLYFYSLIYILKGSLSTTYYEHFIQYILFLRILTKNLINRDEIEYSRILITKYIFEFERLYGSKLLKYNLHAHLHLPDQVDAFAPLHKMSAFCGEGSFKMFDLAYNGTVNIANQIVNNLCIQKENNKIFSQEQIDNMKNPEFRQFASKLFSENNHSQNKNNNNLPKISISSSKHYRLDQLPLDEQRLFMEKHVDTSDAIIQTDKIKYNQKCKNYFHLYFKSKYK
jgi:hypothetical protein